MSKKKSETMEPLKELKTTNKKTLEFYMKNPSIDFVTMNNLMVDILDELLTGMSGDMSKHTTDKINSMMIEQTNNILLLKDQIKSLIFDNKTDMQTIKEMNNDMKNNIIIKLFDIKKEYMTDMKTLIDKHESENIVKIIDRFDKETHKLINDVIPKTSIQYYNQYESMIKLFREDISMMNKGDNFESKYIELVSNIEKSLMSYISTSESRIHNDISDIKNISMQTNIVQEKVNNELMLFLDKTKNSTYKGQMAENQIETIINKLYPYADVKRTADEDSSGDFIMTRTDGIPIMFEIKDYNRNIPTDEITKFVRDVTENNICGIFISISTGICKKRNFEIEISENNNIMLYIHNMNYDSDKIKLGVDIIDNLYSRLKLNNKDDIKISSDLLSLINKEYNTFIIKRAQTIDHIRESSKKTIQYIEELELKTLNDYLSSKFAFKNNNKLRCDICKNFVGTNAKSLAAHQRKCKNKAIDEVEVEDVTNSDDNKTKSPKSDKMKKHNNNDIEV